MDNGLWFIFACLRIWVYESFFYTFDLNISISMQFIKTKIGKVKGFTKTLFTRDNKVSNSPK